MKKLPSFYPIFLNITGKKCVVVGGGEVALRKVEALMERGANIEVISPELCAELGRLGETGDISAIRRQYQPGDLEGAFIAVAATDEHDINLKVTREARERAILVNVVDNPDQSDFIIPSCVRRGDLTIAISTAGSSPALARKIRTRLEKDFGKEYSSLTLLVREARAEVKRQGRRLSGDEWQRALDLDSIIDLLKHGDIEKARALLLDNLKIPENR